MSESFYNPVLQGDRGALKRALYKSMGFTDQSLRKPIIALVNSYTDATPGHFNLNLLTQKAREGVVAAGGTAMTFGVVAPCDGIAEGHTGMRYCLPARDLIASSIECMVRAHRFDGMILLGSCDKIVPGMMMAAARLDIPAVFVNGGPMHPACYKGKHYDGNIITEAIGWKQRGEITQGEFERIENLAEPGCGSCAMLGTANTMCGLAEAMGMALPATTTIPAVSSNRTQVAYDAGFAVMNLLRKGITSRQIMSREGLENAMAALMATGGSTNGILHLQAIWEESGYGELDLGEFGRMSKKIPQVASVYPASPYDMVDFYEAGGFAGVMKEILPLLHRDVLTVTGETLDENMKKIPYSSRREVIRPLDDPFAPEGGVSILKGNLATLGAVVKPAAVPQNLMCMEGPARVFHSEDESIEAILSGEIKPGSVLVLSYEGPKGGPGMPEMYRPMKSLEGMGLSDSCALVTDGRFSGSNRGCFVGHISPEAYEGGALALVKDGDIVKIDIPGGLIELKVSEKELAKRAASWQRVEKDVAPGYLETYRRVSKSAAQGAVVK